MAERINKAPETREQVDTNEANLLENTRGRLAEILEQVWKTPEGLKSFAERFKFDKKTWWAVFLSAMIFASGTGVAKWADNIPYSAEELREISTQLSEEGITEANWERMRQVASYFDEVDEDVIRNCAEKEDMMAKRNCEDERTVEASELEYEVLAAEEEMLAAEEERSLERQAKLDEDISELDEWKQALEILNDVVEWDKQGNEEEVLEAAEYVIENSERFEQQIIDFANTILEQN